MNERREHPRNPIVLQESAVRFSHIESRDDFQRAMAGTRSLLDYVRSKLERVYDSPEEILKLNREIAGRIEALLNSIEVLPGERVSLAVYLTSKAYALLTASKALEKK